MIYECERQRRIGAPAQRVWEWLTVPQHVFSLNVFHVAAEFPEAGLQKGSTIFIQHRFFGVYDQKRFARIRALRPYFIAWGEFAAQERDHFPHSQSLTVIPIDEKQCQLVNRLRGKFMLPGAPYWLHPVYRFVGPWILDNENAQIAMACGEGASFSGALGCSGSPAAGASGSCKDEDPSTA